MSVVLDKTNWLTKALSDEQNFFAEHSWLQELQLQQRLALMTRGLPTRKEEQWKYTDVTFIEKNDFHKITHQENATKLAVLSLQDKSIKLVFVDNTFSAELSDVSLLPEEVICCSLQKALSEYTELVKPYLSSSKDIKEFPFANLNLALLTDGLFLYVPKNVTMTVPVHLFFVNTVENSYSCPRNIIIAEQGSKVTVFEEHSSAASNKYFTNAVTEMDVKSNAQVDYYKMQNDAASGTHIADVFIHQAQDSKVKTLSLALGSHVSRESMRVYLNERGAECSINGFYSTESDGQHIDNHIQIDHVAPYCTSAMVYKGVLNKKSRAVFNGKIYVYPDAQKTKSQQENHNLLLSPDAEVDTKPEFEIYADDVKCAHADTVGQLDAESLFYLRSRGIEKQTALKLLTRAFSDDVLNRVENKAVLQHMYNSLNQKLAYES